MRAALFASIIGWSVGCMIPVTFAREPLTVSSSTPPDYAALKQDLDKIPPYLEASQCGGWQNRSIVDPNTGKTVIATVTGVPGRNGKWNGAIRTGMATREDTNGDNNIDNDFVFPQTTMGLTTACSANREEPISKTVWREKQDGRPGEIEQVTISYPHPKFEDPSCRWRRKLEDGTFSNEAPDVPLLDSYDDPPEFAESTKPPSEEPESGPPGDRQSPPTCIEFCGYLNSWQYRECLETGTAPDPENPLISYTICNRWGEKYLCSDQEVTNAVTACNSNTGDKANSRLCMGAECRCEDDGGPRDASGNPVGGCIENPGTKQDESSVYYSYFRMYNGSYSRDAVSTDKGDDKATDSGPVACFGFYNEFDPKYKQTEPKDRRCVINLNVVSRRDTQTGKSEYGQNSSLADRDPNKDMNQRTAPGANRIPGTFNGETDLWYLKLGGGFSLLNEKVFSSAYNQELSNVYLDSNALDNGKMRATEQLDVRRKLAPGSFIRSFDDTGERAVSDWWQQQQSDVASLMHPPIIRMILPTGWSLGIDPNDPFFAETKAKVLKPADKREDRMEIQIDASDDTLGAALAYLQRSLIFHVVEEPIPAVVPVGSPVEFRGLAEQWCTWYMRRTQKKNCDDAPQDVYTLMRALNTYATDIEQYRLLRAELPLYASKILALQQSVTKPMNDWMLQNINEYQEFLTAQGLMKEYLAQEWRTVQEAYEKFGSQTNMPWCMNQRFTLPVYSLLDDWLPSRTNNGERSADKLSLLTAVSNKDIVIDLSAVAFMSGSITLPVLNPVQVRVTDFPAPPSPSQAQDIPLSYPDLPSVKAIRDALAQAADELPEPEPPAGDIPPITLPVVYPESIAAQVTAMRSIQETIGGMDARYDWFWESIGPLKPDEEGQEDRNGIKQMKEHLECFSWDDKTCQHVEMDLRERWMRIASRPLVFLREDYESKDEPRGIGGPCVAQDDVCSPLHPEEGGEKHLWEVIGPRTLEQSLEDLKKAVWEATLPEPVGSIKPEEFPHYGVENGDLLPSYNVPPHVDLTPVPRSSSSSSSAGNAP